MKLSAFRYQ